MKKRERTYSGTLSTEVTERELRNRVIARAAAAEGFVLLKNEGVLPLKQGEKAALYGGGAVHHIKGGTGSGDVNEREIVGMFQGFQDAGIPLTNAEWLENYVQTYENSREDWKNAILTELKENPEMHFFTAYANHPYQMPDGEAYRAEDAEAADVVFYVISRTAGEGADRYLKAGDYYLTDGEKSQLAFLNEHTENLVVVLNSGGVIDLKEVLKLSHLKGLLNITQPGMEGGHAVADVVSGKVTPGGKLTTTWPVNYEDIPNGENYSHNNGNVDQDFYSEGLYVGYRYFDSFDMDTAYAFGYGLSYTDFSIRTHAVTTENGNVIVTAEVENTGSEYAGKEVVQVYVSAPQEGTEKEFRKLCGFKKTGLLKPGEKETVEIRIPSKNLAFFSEAQSAWMLERGQYGIWVGNSSDALTVSGVLEVASDTVIEKVKHILPLQEKLEELHCPKELRISREQAWKEEAAKFGLTPIPYVPAEETVRQYPVSEAAKMASELTEKLTDEQMIHMVIGEINKGQEQMIGNAGIMVPGAAGETSSILEEEYGVPGVPMADGPAGIRLMKSYEVDRKTGGINSQGIVGALEGGVFAEHTESGDVDTYYQYATAIPVGTLLAQTWDPELLSDVGRAVAVEMEEFGIGWWLAPGMNIHKNPLCGRNFEYFSEDPLVAGTMAAGITRGVQSLSGVGTTIKHFACNSQEDNRMGCDSIVSERTLRELYLRGFEIAVKTSQPMAIMSSYNLVNGVHSANSYDLCTVAAREEWNFQGIIMTDWTTTFPRGGASSAGCISAGNDLIMPGFGGDVEGIREALSDGSLSREDLKACVRRMLTIIFQTNAYEDSVPYGNLMK